ncbi:MAG: Gfo/Idh/MocA family oxidoreductase [Clostridiales bacterium]|nr:Gfo/Idh/MocA family oxidoreductase [Clostridiales bacterium]
MKLGFLGLGQMSRGMAWTAARLPEVEMWACASRDMDRAEIFKQEYGFQKAYGNYEDLYDDPEVELIYIATPHSFHYEQIRSCLEAGKPVLCEKPLTVHAWESDELIRLAEKKHLFLLEAQMLRFMPLVKLLQSILREGCIGQVVSFNVCYSYPLEYKERVMSPELGGGALLDIGVYPLTLADLIMGHDYVHMASDVILTDSGVDAVDEIILRTRENMMANITVSIRGSNYSDAVIIATSGHLVLRDVNHLNRIEQYDFNNRFIRGWDRPDQLSDYVHELRAAISAVREGKCQCQEYDWETMLAQQRLMDCLRKE